VRKQHRSANNPRETEGLGFVGELNAPHAFAVPALAFLLTPFLQSYNYQVAPLYETREDIQQRHHDVSIIDTQSGYKQSNQQVGVVFEDLNKCFIYMFLHGGAGSQTSVWLYAAFQLSLLARFGGPVSYTMLQYHY
jgi:hypothetical protein